MSERGSLVPGIYPALVTPMHEDETIDEASLREHVRRLLAAGAHGLFAGGTNGEFFTMDHAERLRVLEVVLDESAGAVPVMMNSGCITTRDTVALSREAARLGVAALSVVSPYFAVATQDQLVRHFTTVADAADAPVIAYNIPARTGNRIEPGTVARLAADGSIIGVKDSSGDLGNLQAYIHSTPDDFCVLAGSDGLILDCLTSGGYGAVTGVANVLPRTVIGIYRAWRSGDVESAARCQEQVQVFRACFGANNPNTVIKEAANLRDFAVGPCRAPFSGLSDDAVIAIRRALDKCESEEDRVS